ncbi:hypothetical protein PRIPAC_86436 [Pristionchus pacificus]|uniref:Uncharacterized protein n=1 Tax=Pristionchus pacificus TaxID=54126 RepID=A0A2A6BNX5_PRIPA|nr:hypothetical protein PRIPAC_86436 [Pristionchus pacificus]|eukprot:PDM67538.1 hypothetical protein PRIPAC_48955 [Pristionchus pacificus]
MGGGGSKNSFNTIANSLDFAVFVDLDGDREHLANKVITHTMTSGTTLAIKGNASLGTSLGTKVKTEGADKDKKDDLGGGGGIGATMGEFSYSSRLRSLIIVTDGAGGGAWDEDHNPKKKKLMKAIMGDS